tara:strand:- start:3277 stop:3504 length:228 start_codon:yes stop_codon:yes gene_type:complete
MSKQTMQIYISNGPLESIKWKNRTLIKPVSIISFLLEKKLIKVKDLSKKIDVRDLEDLFKDKEKLFFCDVENELI